MVIWLTGLSGSGKTTLALVLWKLLKQHLPEVILLDGDGIREAFKNDLGYREKDRVRQVDRIQKIARLLASQHLIVIVTVVYSHPDLLAWNRKNLPNYFEIYLKAALETVRGRDPKGLYARAKSGECQDIVGLDITWNVPQHPDLILDMDHPEHPETLAKRVIAAVPGLDERWRGKRHAWSENPD